MPRAALLSSVSKCDDASTAFLHDDLFDSKIYSRDVVFAIKDSSLNFEPRSRGLTPPADKSSN